MNSLDAHGILRAHLLRQTGTKKSGKVLHFRCPRHADSKASAWLGDHAWGCMACDFTEPLSSLAETLGVEIPDETPASAKGLTVQQYAERKGLALDGLVKAGVKDGVGRYGDQLVLMPYYSATGEVIRTKCRTLKGTFWLPDGEGTPLYGIWMLASLPGPVVIVEGESDCHAAWQRGVCAVGLPGASMWKPEFAALLAGRDVIAWQEPDEGGATMVAKVAIDLPKAKILQNVQYKGRPVKDLCDLHQAVQASGDTWATVWAEVLEVAMPIGASPPVVAFDSISGATLEVMLTEKLEPVVAIPTMLPKWNESCKGRGGGVGLAKGWMITIGGRPGYGKTQTALNVAASAITYGKTVAFVSLEMGRSDLGTSLMAIASGETVAMLEQGESFDRDAYKRAAAFMDDTRRTMGGHVLVNRRPLHRWHDVDSAIRYLVEYEGAEMVIMDYLQLAHVENARKKEEAIEATSNGYRRLIDDLRVAGIALSQFNRETSKDREQRPQAQGLMGSSSIENDSHQVVLLDHSRYTRTGNFGDTWVIIDKNRHGPVLDIPVQWDYRTLRLTQSIPSIADMEKKHGPMLPKWKERN